LLGIWNCTNYNWSIKKVIVNFEEKNVAVLKSKVASFRFPREFFLCQDGFGGVLISYNFVASLFRLTSAIKSSLFPNCIKRRFTRHQLNRL
jgi:hypothetical protein